MAKPTKTLEETVDLMLSDDWKDRLKAEYYQLENRYIALTEHLLEQDLNGNDGSPQHTRFDQQNSMRMYLASLKRIAKAEGIEL